MAIINSGLAWPATKRITILLSPADLPKRGTHFDLAIAVARAGRRRPGARRRRCATPLFIGELTLAGGLRCVPGVLPMVLAAAERGIDRVFVPEPQAREAAMVPGMEVFGMRSLAQVGAELARRGGARGAAGGAAVRQPAAGLARRRAARGARPRRPARAWPTPATPSRSRRPAATTCCSPGPRARARPASPSGSRRILPDLSREESLELTAIHSLAGILDPAHGLIDRGRPSAAPHHDASKASLHRRRHAARCGPASSAGPTAGCSSSTSSRCSGPTSSRRCASRWRAVTSPSRRQGSRRCSRPGGWWCWPATRARAATTAPRPATTAASAARCVRRDYRRKISGPIADRIDITRNVEPLSPARARTTGSPPASRRPSSGPGSSRPGACRPTATPTAAGGSTPRRPGRRCASGGRSAPSCAAPGRRRGLRGPAHPPRRDPRPPARLDRRRPGAASTTPGAAEVDVALRLRIGRAPARPARVAAGPDERRPTRAPGPGGVEPRSPSPVTRG